MYPDYSRVCTHIEYSGTSTRVTLRNGCDPAKNSDPTYPTLQRTLVLAGYVQLC